MSPISFYITNVATRKLKLTRVVCIVFLLGGADLDSASKPLKTVSYIKKAQCS